MHQQAVESAPVIDWYGADAFLAVLKRVVLIAGGFGSGKTEVAVNFALHLRALGRRVSIADLDIVNPYFRSREVRREMRAQGIEVLVPSEGLIHADLPIVQPEIRGALGTSPGHLLLDLGGDPVGARVMASLADAIRPDEYAGFMVLNSRRPRTDTVAGAKRMMADIALSARTSITDLVVNSHLIEETSAAVIDEGIALAEAVSRETGARVAFVAVERRLLDRFDARACPYPVMVLDRLMLKPWEPSNWLGRYRVNI